LLAQAKTMSLILPQTAITQSKSIDNYAKGKAFEFFIIRLFKSQSFHLKKWRKSEKLTDTFFSIDHFNPDLEIELVFRGAKKYRFAVECKWRQNVYDGKIKWGTDSQICSYRMFQDRLGIPVFVAIGIGGQPSAPEKLYVTPLNNIWMHNDVHESDLIPFKRRPMRNFYFDIPQLRLF
jgi:hypothetical protein